MALEPNENPEESVLRFESMLKTDNVYFFDSEDFEEIIHHYLNQGKVTLGRRAIQIALRQHPHSAELRLLYVEVLVLEAHFSEAESILNELQEIDSSNEEIYIQRANILSKQDNHQGAVNMLLEALQITDDGFDIYSLMGMEHLFLDHFEEAKQCFIKCLEYDEGDYSALYNVVHCFEFLEDFDGAIHYLNDYLERNPYCEVAWHQLGKMYCSKDMYTEALAAFDFAIISDDCFLGAYFEKGRVLERLGKFKEAIQCYETTMLIDDPTPHAYLRIGKCYEKLGNDDMAKYHFYNTVHEDPLLDKGWVAITEYYFRIKDYKKALRYINKAINIDEKNPLYWKKNGEIFQVLKNYNEADFAYKQTVELGNYELDTWKNWGQTLGKLQDFESALRVVLQGLEFYPEDAELLYLLSGIYLKRGNAKLAKEKLHLALQLNPKKYVVFLQLYPEFKQIKWIQESISATKRAST